MREMPIPPNRHLGIIASTTLLSRLRTFKLSTPISATLKTVTHVPRNARATLLTPSLRLWARLHSAALTFCYPASTCVNLASLRAIARHACEAVVLIMQRWHFAAWSAVTPNKHVCSSIATACFVLTPVVENSIHAWVPR